MSQNKLIPCPAPFNIFPFQGHDRLKMLLLLTKIKKLFLFSLNNSVNTDKLVHSVVPFYRII